MLRDNVDDTGPPGEPLEQVPLEIDRPPTNEPGAPFQETATYTHMITMLERPGYQNDEENITALNEAGAAIIAFLEEGKPEEDYDKLEDFMRAKMNILWARDEVFQFVITSMRFCISIRNETTLPLQLKALWILENLILFLNPVHIVKLEESNLIYLLIYFLKSPDEEVYDQAICILARLTQISRARLRQQLLIYSSYIVSIFRFLLSPNRTRQWTGDSKLVKCMVRIVRGILLPPAVMEAALNENLNDYRAHLGNENAHGVVASLADVVDGVLRGNPDLKTTLPSPSTVQLCLPLISDLLHKYENMGVTCDMLCCVSICMRIFEKTDELADTDIFPRVLNILSRSDNEVVMSHVAIIIGQLASDQDHLRSFLKIVQRHGGLEGYWKILKGFEGESVNQELQKNVTLFLRGMTNLIASGNEESIWLVLESGIIYTLPHCLDKNLPSEVQFQGILLSGHVLKNLKPETRRKFIQTGKITVTRFLEVLSGTEGKEHPVGPQVLAYLVESCPSRRNEAVSLGVISSLLRALKKWTSSKDNQHVAWILNAISKILEVKPRAPLETFQDVPAGIQLYWKKMPFSTERKEERIAVATHILAMITGYGVEGIELILQQADLLPKVMANLSSKNESIQDASMETIFQICKATKEHRLNLLKDGLLRKFVSVLLSSNVATRKMAIECLYGFITERILTLEQKIFMRTNLWTQVRIEVSRDNEETRLMAGYVNEGIRDMFLARNRYDFVVPGGFKG